MVDLFCEMRLKGVSRRVGPWDRGTVGRWEGGKAFLELRMENGKWKISDAASPLPSNDKEALRAVQTTNDAVAMKRTQCNAFYILSTQY